MESLREIHERDGLPVVCNLHTLDTARRYCDRIVGMQAGKLVFDGTPDQLDSASVREIYGADESLDESTTSTELTRAAKQSAVMRAVEASV